MADNLTSFIPTTDTVVLNKLWTIVDEFGCGLSLKSMVQKACLTIVRVSVVYGAYFIYKYGLEFAFSPVKRLLFRLIYKRMVIEKSKQTIFKTDGSIVQDGIFPLFFEKEDHEHAVYHIPYFHQTMMSKLNKELMEANGQTTLLLDNDKKIRVPLDMFPSNNYLELEALLDGYFEVFNFSRMVSSPLILINGKPGLGKSDLRYYLASLNKYDEIIYYNLHDMTTRSFASIIAGFMDKGSDKKTVVFIDELDKYVELYVRHMYKLDKRGKNSSDEIVDADIQTFRNDVKSEIIRIISNLPNLIHKYTGGIAFVFGANNFQTLFEGLKQKHINSVKTRFTFIDFKECQKPEIIKFLRVFNERLRNTRYYYDEVRLNLILRRINDDIKITYRDISICTNKARYDIEQLVYFMNEGVYNPLLEHTYTESTGSHIISESKKEDIQEEDEELVIRDTKMDEISRLRTEQKSKESLAKEIFIMIDGDENSTEETLLTDEEVLTRMIEMSKGWHLMEIVEFPIKIQGDLYTIIDSAIIPRNLIKCATYLFDHCGADVNFSSTYNGSLLKTAIINNYIDMILLLLERGAKWTQHSLISVKSVHTLTRMITFLIQKEQFDINGYENLLSKCYRNVKNNRNELIEFFVQLGYKINDSEKIEILEMLNDTNAIPELKTLELLLEYGFKFDVYLTNGVSFFYRFILKYYKDFETHNEIFDFLTAHGAHKIPFCSNRKINIDQLYADGQVKELLKRFNIN